METIKYKLHKEVSGDIYLSFGKFEDVFAFDGLRDRQKIGVFFEDDGWDVVAIGIDQVETPENTKTLSAGTIMYHEEDDAYSVTLNEYPSRKLDEMVIFEYKNDSLEVY